MISPACDQERHHARHHDYGAAVADPVRRRLFTETIFSWPGMGRLFYYHAQRVDYPVLMGIVMINSVLIIAFNLLADMAYAYLDPRAL